jgi:hypothetical protein
MRSAAAGLPQAVSPAISARSSAAKSSQIFFINDYTIFNKRFSHFYIGSKLDVP